MIRTIDSPCYEPRAEILARTCWLSGALAGMGGTMLAVAILGLTLL